MVVNLPLLLSIAMFGAAILALTVGFCYSVADNSVPRRRRPIRRRAA